MFLLPFAAQAQLGEGQRYKHFNQSGGVAINGYDPVAYFTEGKARKGNSSFQYKYSGVTYRFASQANLDKFKQNPAAYEPQYGGWCAYAMGKTNDKVTIDPGTFKILNGKLYLFYNSWGTNTLTTWNQDENNLKNKADQNWSVMSAK